MKFKSYSLTITAFALLAFFVQIPLSQASNKGMNIFNDIGNKIENLEDSKDYEKERILVIAGDQKISTEVNSFLTTAMDVLPPQTYQLLALPLALTYLQKMPMAKIKVKNFDMTSIEFNNTIPAELSGLGSVILVYEGDNDPLRKLITNIRVRVEKRAVTK